jgi:GNAT superfamily N-acetyltransferase
MNRTALKSGETDPWARSLAFHGVLRDGRRVRVRPISPGDKGRLVDALLRMSARSRHLRFHQHRMALTDDELRYLTELDYRRHVAWGAMASDEPGRPGVGVARLIRDPDGDAAEFSVTVVDAWQGVGLGKLLLQTLMVSAAEYGVTRLVGHVLRENEPALRMFHHVGGRTIGREGDTVVVEIPVVSAVRRPRASEALLSVANPDPSAR